MSTKEMTIKPFEILQRAPNTVMFISGESGKGKSLFLALENLQIDDNKTLVIDPLGVFSPDNNRIVAARLMNLLGITPSIGFSKAKVISNYSSNKTQPKGRENDFTANLKSIAKDGLSKYKTIVIDEIGYMLSLPTIMSEIISSGAHIVATGCDVHFLPPLEKLGYCFSEGRRIEATQDALMSYPDLVFFSGLNLRMAKK